MKRVLFFFLLSFFTISYSQLTAERALQNLESICPQENIYLLTDKDYYLNGDTIWFSAAVFNSLSASDVSSNLFVELYDRDKKIIVKGRFPVMNGFASGSLTLSDKLDENVYFLRAYTPMMSNLNEDFQYFQEIPVYNPNSPKMLVHTDDKYWTVTAHPESNILLSNINTKIAVRLHTKGTPPSQWSGYVTEASQPDNKIATFKGLDGNVGVFQLTPEKGKKYQVTVLDNLGTKQVAVLPEVAEVGVSLKVISDKDNVKFIIKDNRGIPQSYYKAIGNMGNLLVYQAKINKLLDDGFNIPTAKLVNGILQISIFDEKENLLVSRMCFVMPQQLHTLEPKVTPEISNSEKRAANTLSIGALKYVPGYSVAVFDPEYKKSLSDNNMLSTLWLTGTIRSKINSPAQYFASNRNVEALDALLISEKWSVFNWGDIIAGKYPKIVDQPSKYLTFDGKVFVNGKLAPDKSILLWEDKGLKNGINEIVSNSEGKFQLENLSFDEPQKIYYAFNGGAAKPNQTSGVYVTPTNSYTPLKKDLPKILDYELADRKTGEAKQTPELTKLVNAQRYSKSIGDKVNKIEEVRITAKKRDATEELNKTLSSSRFHSINETIIDFINDDQPISGAMDIRQWLQGRVAGLTVSYNQGKPVLSIRGGEVSFFLDEMPLDQDAMSSVSVNDIAMIKVVKGPLLGAGGSGSGSILIYTKRGNMQSVNDKKNMAARPSDNFFVLEGYSKTAKFLNPDYGNAEMKTVANDNRAVLDWSPWLEIENGEPVKVDFYNSDSVNKPKVLILGFDPDSFTPLYFYQDVPSK